jgi:hypothetical protein
MQYDTVNEEKIVLIYEKEENYRQNNINDSLTYLAD